MEAGGGGLNLRTDGPIIPLPSDAGIEAGRKVLFGVRPEHLALDPVGGIECRVSVVEPNGNETMIVAACGLVTFKIVVHERVSFKPGDAVRFSAKGGLCHFFDMDSGKRIGSR